MKVWSSYARSGKKESKACSNQGIIERPDCRRPAADRSKATAPTKRRISDFLELPGTKREMLMHPGILGSYNSHEMNGTSYNSSNSSNSPNSFNTSTRNS